MHVKRNDFRNTNLLDGCFLNDYFGKNKQNSQDSKTIIHSAFYLDVYKADL